MPGKSGKPRNSATWVASEGWAARSGARRWSGTFDRRTTSSTYPRSSPAGWENPREYASTTLPGPSRTRARRPAIPTIAEESSPPLRNTATGVGLRSRQRTASRKISRKCAAYSSSER